MFGLGMGELLVICVVVFFLFGAKKLPQLGGSMAEAIKNFKKGMKEVDDAMKDDVKKEIENKEEKKEE